MTTPDPELTGGAGNLEDTEPGGGNVHDPELTNSGQGTGSNTPKDPAPNFAEGTTDPEMQPHPSSVNVDNGGEAGEGGAGSYVDDGTPDPEQTATGTHTDEGRVQSPGTVDPETPNSGEGGTPRQADYPATPGTQDPEMPTQP